MALRRIDVGNGEGGIDVMVLMDTFIVRTSDGKSWLGNLLFPLTH